MDAALPAGDRSDRRRRRACPLVSRGQGETRQTRGAAQACVPDRGVADHDLSAAVDAGQFAEANSQIFGQLSLWPSEFRWQNYSEGWNGMAVSFGVFFRNSLFVTVLSVIGNVISCSFTAYAFARLEFTGKNIWFALMMMTLMIPYHVVLIPQYLLFLQLGWVDSYLPLIVPQFLAGDAFFIFLMVQFFRQLPRELDEAAMIDGCSPFKIYWAIIMPLSIRRSPRRRSFPSSGPGTISSGRWSISTTSRTTRCRWRCACSTARTA